MQSPVRDALAAHALSSAETFSLRKRGEPASAPLAYSDCLRFRKLERDPQTQADRTAIVDTFLLETADEAAKVVVACDVARSDRQDFQRVRINPHTERSQPSKRAATTSVCVRRKQRMVKDIVNVGSELKLHPFGHLEGLVQPQVHAPGTRPVEHVALGHLGIVEDIGPDCRRPERGRIPNLVPTLLVVIADNEWAVRRLGIEVTHGIERRNSDIPGEHWSIRIRAVIAGPERRESSSGFG